MASKTPTFSSSATFFLINLLFFTLLTASHSCGTCRNPGPGTGSGARCPRDALKLGVCANVLGLIRVSIGAPPTLPCCSLLQGLADLEAALCLCTAIRANILGINLNLPVTLSLVLNNCGRNPPNGFICP
ncbi:unnamed protein product [Coffea canephora]|uniref:Bifunctional inhibitor/plant lipid transfer protein/seed storage helical domain-containing protein n=1 Tax=Coffea canephora TaxID=49390 RepID=A0A068UCG4_COFCA|nr:unnamed protein product [Coffea canephora]